MDVTLHHFCHYITVPSLHNLSALHQWRPCVRLTSSSCRGNERHKQTVTGEKKEKTLSHFFRGEKHPIMEWTFSLGEKQIWCYSDKTPQQLLIFSISFCRLSQSRRHVLSSPFQSFPVPFSLQSWLWAALCVWRCLGPSQPPPSASLSAASSKLERCWRALSQCKCVLNSTRGSGRKNPLLFFWVRLSLCCVSALLE